MPASVRRNRTILLVAKKAVFQIHRMPYVKPPRRSGLKNVNREHGKDEKSGGGEGTRTPNPLLAKQVLSPLSYAPRLSVFEIVAPCPVKDGMLSPPGYAPI